MSCFRLSRFRKRRAVKNSQHVVRVDDDPLPHLKLVNDTHQDRTLVDNPILDHPAVDYPLPDLILVHIPLPPDLRADDYPLPDLTSFENPLVYHQSVDINPVPRCVLPAAKNSAETNLHDLPNHIITDILIRLPAECVFHCQRASKLLEILARNPFFIRTHLAQSTSIIALQSFSQSNDREIKFYFMHQQKAKKVVESSNLKLDLCYTKRDYPVMLYDSYDGFLLFKNKNDLRSIFVVWNPITEEQVTITMEDLYLHFRFQVCGFYFNPHNKEYEILLIYKASRDGEYVFDILSFGSKLRRNIGTYSYMPSSDRAPTIINGKLYWIVDSANYREVQVNCSYSIMAFEIRTNKFSTMGHGGASCEDGQQNYWHGYCMHLTEMMKGQLGLCRFNNPYTNDLVIWILNPRTNSWAKAHSVTLPQYSMPKYFSCWPNILDVEVVKIKDGKLLVRQYNRLLLCDLDLGTHKIVEKKGFEDDNFRPVIHTPSLVSLNTDKLIELRIQRP